MGITNIAKTVGITLANGAASGFIGSLPSILVGLEVQRDKKKFEKLVTFLNHLVKHDDPISKRVIRKHMITGFVGGLIGSALPPASEHFAPRIIMSLIGGCFLSGCLSELEQN